jgi:serine/threonine-protein kinase
MRQAIFKALSKDREQRQASAREFFAELSDGGRVTVEAPPPAGISAAHASTGTAAMDMVPNFQAAPVASAPAPGPHYAGPTGTPGGIAAHVPPAGVTSRKKSGSGKGLVIGLGAVGAVLLVAIAVVAARTLSPDEEEPPLVTATSTPPTSGASTGPLTIAPVETAPTPAAPVAATAPVAAPTQTPTPNKPSSTPAGQAKSPAAGTPAAAGGGCEACVAQASRENIPGAVAALRSCSDEAKKQACTAQIRRAAPSAAKHAALNGNCGQAKAIVAAAQSIGAPAGPLTAALSNTSCK